MKDKLIEKISELISNQNYVIFGSGSTVNAVIDKIGSMNNIKSNLMAFSASSSTSQKLKSYGVQEATISYLHYLSDTTEIICVDSLDQIIINNAIRDSQFIKGHGAALLKEKIVWAMANKVLVVLDQSKITQEFTKFIPVEVIPAASEMLLYQFTNINSNFAPKLRVHGRSNSPVITDNGNYLLDIHYSQPMKDLSKLHDQLKSLLGVVETGIFTNNNFKSIELLIAYEDRIEHLV